MKPDCASTGNRVVFLRQIWSCGLSAAALLLAGGCASGYDVKVDSLAKPKAEDAISYQIHNKNPLAGDDSLRYKEAANYVRTRKKPTSSSTSTMASARRRREWRRFPSPFTA